MINLNIHIAQLRRLAVICAALMGLQAFAEDALPQVTRFYPGAKAEEPYMECKDKAYIYFAAGTKALAADAQIVQNDAVIGTVHYSVEKASAYLIMDPSKPENADMANVQAGNFEFRFYTLTYIDANDVQQQHSDVDNPYASVFYRCLGAYGKVVGETGFEDRTMLSFYPADSDQGVKTYTFDKPIVAADVRVNLEYGNGLIPSYTHLPFKVSDDCLTITIDWRGILLNPGVLAPGVKFVDQYGKPTDPPSEIALNIEGLNCQDGTRIESICVSLDGEYSVKREGSIFESMHYIDLTFANPEITDAKFWNSADPDAKFGKIEAGCDMMEVLIEGMDVIKSGTLVLAVGSTRAEVNDYVRGDGKLTLPIPASILAVGSERLVISMDNLEWTIVDGVTNHKVIELDLGNRPFAALTLSEVWNVEPGKRVAISSPEGLNVTFSSDLGYMFIEDYSAGLQVFPSDNDAFLTQGTKLVGKVVGTYQGNGLLVIDRELSKYTESYIDVDYPNVVLEGDITPLTSTDQYNNRLVMIASDPSDFEYDEQGGYIMIKSEIPALLNFVGDIELPSVINNICGIYYNNPAMGQPMLIVRNQFDINRLPSTVTAIAALRQMAPGTHFEVEVADCMVTFDSDDYRFAIIEDRTAAVQLFSDHGTFLKAGTKFSGTIKGVAEGEAIIVEEADCDITVEDYDVTYGSEIPLSKIGNADNTYRLVTYHNGPGTPIISAGRDVYVGEEKGVYVCDLFGFLPDDYKAPENIESVTGFIYPMNIAPTSDDYDDYEMPNLVYVVIRSPQDIKATTESITDVAADAAADGKAYDLLGRPVNLDAKSLPRGFYIINGKKVVK